MPGWLSSAVRVVAGAVVLVLVVVAIVVSLQSLSSGRGASGSQVASAPTVGIDEDDLTPSTPIPSAVPWTPVAGTATPGPSEPAPPPSATAETYPPPGGSGGPSSPTPSLEPYPPPETYTPAPVPTSVPPTPTSPPMPEAPAEVSYSYQEVVVAKVGSGPGEVGIVQKYGPPTGPSSFALDQTGNIYILDGVNGRVNEYDSQGSFVQAILYEQGVSAGDLAVDGEGRIYLLDMSRWGSVRQYDATGKLLRTYDHSGPETLIRVSLDGAGNVLVADGYAVWAIGNQSRQFTPEERAASVSSGYSFGRDAYSLEHDRAAGIFNVTFSDGRHVFLPTYADEGTLNVLGLEFINYESNINIYVVTVIEKKGYEEFPLVLYDRWGRMVTAVSTGERWFAVPGRRYIVDDAGNFYRLVPLEHEVRVVKWQVK